MSRRKVTIQDVHACGYCVAGIRDWFKAHDKSFMDFCRNGMDQDELEKMNDAMGNSVLKYMREQDNGH
ncbi:hypothetical protein Q669_29465 [Labrenzia sp. C1B10]|uniref:hypothetical protein n=1 Tax=unclassified Labrenzia TaxID=2648686 RepID=UPI0003B80F92|nr:MULTISPECIES: hypothetical protein [unclassified Labrenzia]ERP95699.1 hypothetical protein Q669_29465 [Labrenzia sp. C1B10]ERS05765.1 hypothetical protein Q675_29030 [Labrenzia sp. C1B70]